MKLDTALETYPGAVAFRFGDGPALNGEILALVCKGVKTVSCDALASFAARGEALPVPGRIDIACDWDWRPICAVQTVALDVMAFEAMTEDLVADQGEFSDLEDWRRGYRAYLKRSVGFEPGIDMAVERFRLVEDFT